jgi:hypothetical protein
MKLLPQSYKTPFCHALKTFQNVKLQKKKLWPKSHHHTWLKRDEQPHTNEKKHIYRNKMPKPRPLFAMEKKVSSPRFDE